MFNLMPAPALTASVRICYQPVVCLVTGRLDHVEVLARAEGDDGAILGPESILDAMTGRESSMHLTAAIIRRALVEYEIHDFAAYNLTLAFNLPLDAMLHPDLAPRIGALRSITSLPPWRMRFELTERHPVHDLTSARQVIAALRDAGHGLALDDITPDLPYLDALMDMDISAVKLDRSVVIHPTPAHEAFIRAVVAHAVARGQFIVAEGIETPDQRAYMRALGATHGQGYLFARPLDAGALRAFLRG